MKEQEGPTRMTEELANDTATVIEVASFCWQILGQAEFTRTDVVISVGGGVVVFVSGAVIGNVIVYRDEQHLTVLYAETLKDEL